MFGKKTSRPIPKGIKELNDSRFLKSSIHSFPADLLNEWEKPLSSFLSLKGIQHVEIFEEREKWCCGDVPEKIKYITTKTILVPTPTLQNKHSVNLSRFEGGDMEDYATDGFGFLYRNKGKTGTRLLIRNVAIHKDDLQYIDSLVLRGGNNNIDEIQDMDFFHVLQQVLGLEKNVDEEGFCILPFHLNLMGLPRMGYHDFTLTVNYNFKPRNPFPLDSIRLKLDFCAREPRWEEEGWSSGMIPVIQFPILQTQRVLFGEKVFQFTANKIGSYLMVKFDSEEFVAETLAIIYGDYQLGPFDHPLLLQMGNFGVYDLFFINFSRVAYFSLHGESFEKYSGKIQKWIILNYSMFSYSNLCAMDYLRNRGQTYSNLFVMDYLRGQGNLGPVGGY